MGAETKTCEHEGLYWYAAPADEAGWKCVDCDLQPGEPPGYSPQHDRELIETKVGCVLHDLHDAKIIHVSNSSHGDGITGSVARRCVREGVFDSVSIAKFILEGSAGDHHRDFWKERGEKIIAGKDDRERCACGQLATVFSSRGNIRTSSCSEHWSTLDEKEPF